MNIIVNGAQVDFVEGKLVLAYFNVSFSAGQFPNSLSGTLQIKSEQGVSMETSQADVATVAKKLIQAMVADTAAEGNK
ncbi:hypothetical protein N2E94_08720 [Leuconostoc citreum]|uniref:hypothetical protein n=1 Tax=Leuconostoc citreum TaxID=33964 RepID=UPI0002465812|nr:hypothetical protein [Leuconostoc citreum]CCF28429.1 Putative uncharacterized protein [Leuconostoc citreum LBAE E16]